MSSYACSSEASGEYSVAYTALAVTGLISIIVNCVRVVECVGEMPKRPMEATGRWVAPRKSSQCFLYYDP